MEHKFKIGDKAFKATYGRHEKLVTCPDCGGSRHVLVILHDGTEITIECGGCDPGGYQPSTGRIKQYEYCTEVKEYTVTGFRLTAKDAEYELNNFGGCSYTTAKEDALFATYENAMFYGDSQKPIHEAEENKRLMAKTKDAKSWAWNATYHRKCIKDHEHQLEYHRSKVQICAAKAKVGK